MIKAKPLKAQYLKAQTAYYETGTPIMTDAQFDQLEANIRAIDPQWSKLKKTGIKTKKKPVKLTHFMPSLNKAYPEEIGKWLAKNGEDHIVMDKLDGSALQVTYTQGKVTKIVTRGDGETGGDITFLQPYISGLWRLKHPVSLVVRCEAVMPEKVFKKKWASEFDNARNLVNGILNRTTPHPALADIHVVVLGVYGWPMEEALKMAKSEGMHEVPYAKVKVTGSELLTGRLALRMKQGPFKIDGLVLAPPDFKMEYKNSDKPKGIIAFKVNDEANAQEVEIKEIIWQVTGHGRIIPKIRITPTHMDGVMVEFATSHNAKWLMDRNIGPGAVVKVLRSGGVIPKIVGVVKPAKRWQGPDVDYVGKGVHFIVRNSTAETSDRIGVLQILKFMRTMGIEHVAEATIAASYKNLDTAYSWVRRWCNGVLDKRLTNDGMGPKQRARVIGEFDRVLKQPIPIAKLMVASHSFDAGVGLRRLQMLEKAGISLGKMMRSNAASQMSSILAVKGFSDKTARLIVSGLKDFEREYLLYEQHLNIVDAPPKPKKAKVGGKFAGQFITFTGYRDTKQEEAITSQGGEIIDFGSKTTTLLYKAGGKESTKLDKARAKGIKVTTFDTL